MKLNFQTLAALVFVPVTTNAWSYNSYGLATRPMVLSSPSSVFQQALQQQQAILDRAYKQRSSPRYEIIDNDQAFQVAIDVPGVKVSDINVKIEEDGQVLSITGVRKTSKFETKFSQSFSLDPQVDIEKFSAVFENGVLTVSAPKDFKKIEENVRNIPIIEATSEREDQEETDISKDSLPVKDAANVEENEVIEL